MQGAAADLSEMEYISALHQTQLPDIRRDGTISATDICIFLRSKYGIVIHQEEANDIVMGLSGRRRGCGCGCGCASFCGNDRNCHQHLEQEQEEDAEADADADDGALAPQLMWRHSQYQHPQWLQRQRQKSNRPTSVVVNEGDADADAKPTAAAIPVEDTSSSKPVTATAPRKHRKKRMMRSIDPLLTENASRIKQIMSTDSTPLGKNNDDDKEQVMEKDMIHIHILDKDKQDEEEDESLDLVELVSVLLIPTLVRLARYVLVVSSADEKVQVQDNSAGEHAHAQDNNLAGAGDSVGVEIRESNDADNDNAQAKAQTQTQHARDDSDSCKDDDGIERNNHAASYKILRDMLEVVVLPLVMDARSTNNGYYSSFTPPSSSYYDEHAAAEENRHDGVGNNASEREHEHEHPPQRISSSPSSPSQKSFVWDDSSTSDQRLSTSKARRLLEHFRLVYPGSDCDEVVQGMVEALLPAPDNHGIGSKSGSGLGIDSHSHSPSPPHLDVLSFARALTSDIDCQFFERIAEPLDMDSAHLTTSVVDVFGTEMELERVNRKRCGCGREDPVAQVSRQSRVESQQVIDGDVGVDVGVDHDHEPPPDESANTNNTSAKNVILLPTYKTTKPHIDYIADTLRSIMYVEVIWLFFIFTFLYYLSIIGVAIPESAIQCDSDPADAFGCKLGQTVLTWLVVALLLSFSGLLIMGPLSRPNNPFTSSRFEVIKSVLVAVAAAVAPLVGLYIYREGVPHAADGTMTELEHYLTNAGNGTGNGTGTTIFYIVVIVASILILFQIGMLLKVSILDRCIVKKQWTPKWLIPAHTLWSVQRKVAAGKKMNSLLHNALKLHSCVVVVCEDNTDTMTQPPPPLMDQNDKTVVHSNDNHNHNKKQELVEDAMLNFVLHGEEVEAFGSFGWTWRGILNGDLYVKEGFNVPSRLWVGQIAQILTVFFFVLTMTAAMYSTIDSSETKRTDIEDDIIVLRGNIDEVLMFIPEKWM
jgi:hypothetical protein